MNAAGSTVAADSPDDNGFERRIELPDDAATTALGAALAPLLARGDVLALSGELGAGKTTLARGILRALGHGGAVPSPTFTLVQHYETKPVPVAHFDLYRIEQSEEIIELGFDEARADGIVLVEWPERLGPHLPAARLDIILDYDATGRGRTACLRGAKDWAGRLHTLNP